MDNDARIALRRLNEHVNGLKMTLDYFAPQGSQEPPATLDYQQMIENLRADIAGALNELGDLK